MLLLLYCKCFFGFSNESIGSANTVLLVMFISSVNFVLKVILVFSDIVV